MSEPTFDTPDAAQAAFYVAFEAADLEAMMAVWAPGDECVCVHPMGARLQGRAAVEASWKELFAGGPGLRFTVADVRRITTGDLAVYCVHEDIRHGPGHDQRARVIATNVYRRTDAGWRMVLHHGSPGAAPAPGAAREPGATVH